MMVPINLDRGYNKYVLQRLRSITSNPSNDLLLTSKYKNRDPTISLYNINE